MAKAELVIHVIAGTPRTHIWCDVCLTSAVVEVDVDLFSDRHGPGARRTLRRCTRCRADDQSQPEGSSPL